MGHGIHIPRGQEGIGCILMYRHCDCSPRLPGEEVDEPEGKMESPVEDWKPSFWA